MKNRNLFLKAITIAVFVGSALFLLNACGKEEMQKIKSENDTLKSRNETLKSENETLKGQIASLQQEVSKLKETADYHYQQGVGLFKDNKLQEAKTEFDIVIEKYPESPLISSAKENLKKISLEIRRVEAEKLTAEDKSPAETRDEWMKFRGNENAYKGKVVTWKCVYTGFHATGSILTYKYEASELYLKDDRGKKVYVDGGYDLCGYFDKTSYPVWKSIGRINQNDILAVTGEFVQVWGGGIYLKPIKFKKIGFVE